MIAVLAVFVLAALHAGPLAGILAAFGAAVFYSLVTIVHPVHRCPRCQGKRVLVTGRASRRRSKACRMCKATGRTRRFAAGHIHRLAWSLLGPSLKERLDLTHEKLREKAGYPE